MWYASIALEISTRRLRIASASPTIGSSTSTIPHNREPPTSDKVWLTGKTALPSTCAQ